MRAGNHNPLVRGIKSLPSYQDWNRGILRLSVENQGTCRRDGVKSLSRLFSFTSVLVSPILRICTHIGTHIGSMSVREACLRIRTLTNRRGTSGQTRPRWIRQMLPGAPTKLMAS